MLPRGAQPPFRVWVNGVEQREGVDYVVTVRGLRFRKALVKEGRLGFWRWLSLFLGVAGTYRQNDSVDVVYDDASGRRVVQTGLPLRPDS